MNETADGFFYLQKVIEHPREFDERAVNWAGDKEQAVFYCRKTLDIISLDIKADPATLDSLKQTVLDKLKNLEKK